MDEKTRKSFARNLKTRRASLGWTQADLCDASDVSICAITNYESCKTEPGVANLIALAGALHCTIDDLLFADPVSRP